MILAAGVALPALTLVTIGGLVTGMRALIMVGSTVSLVNSANLNYRLKKWARVPTLQVRDDNGKLLRLTRNHAHQSKILPFGNSYDCSIEVAHAEVLPATGLFKGLGHKELAAPAHSTTRLSGAAAQRALSTIVAQVNAEGGSKRQVKKAVELIDASSSLHQMLHTAPVHGGTFGDHLLGHTSDDLKFIKGGVPVGRLPSLIRLALEMSVHENDERRAMEGELHELEARWRDADAIAKIADEMFLPNNINDRVSELHNSNHDRLR